MRILFIGLTLLTTTSQAVDCPPLSTQGNPTWINNNANPPMSLLTPEFRGGNCEDSIYVTAQKNSNVANYSYLMSHINKSTNRFYYGFSLDFADILSVLNSGSRLDIFELYVLPTDVTSPNIDHNKVLSISIGKIDSAFAFANNNEWILNFIWTDLVDSFGITQVVNSHAITFDGDITEGLLHINVNWNNHNLQGGSANVNVYSNMIKTDPSTGDSQTIMLTSDDGITSESGLQRVVMSSDHFIKNVAPSLYKIGLINSDSGVSFGDGITFYTPYRE